MIATKPGYIGGHLEAVEVIYDPEVISYQKLLKFFFKIHDPTQKDGQGPDIGPQYHSVLFYLTEGHKKIASEMLASLKKKGLPVVTELRPANTFYPAEERHCHFISQCKF